MNVWQTDEQMRSLLHDERIGQMAATLSQVDGVRVWYDQTFVKRPWAGPTPLHQDNPYWSFTSTDALTIWVALDDVDLKNGALCYLPGTHLLAEWKQAEDVTIDSIFGVHPGWRSIEPVFCPIRAGGVLWHNGLTVHGSGANLSPHPRRAINCAFMPDGATFNGQQNVLPDDVYSRYRIGDVLDDDERNPLIFARARGEDGQR
jgi:ectoine hydroxylase-related dioxygenase (phytanoyl-CoA dioxygenase family)